jgi:hypothetical protein
MNTVQFAMAILNWLQADPTHVAFAASAIAAFTPTPHPGSVAGKLYRVLDFFALNFLHAKDTGVKPADVTQVAEQVAALLASKSTTAPATTEKQQ